MGSPILGIHRPYLTDSELRALTGDEAMSSVTQVRAVLEIYLKEMSVPTKYADLMYAVPKDEILWISKKEFEMDFDRVIPELKDWIAAQCDKRTDIEKAMWTAFAHKSGSDLTTEERSIGDLLVKKMFAIDECAREKVADLSRQTHLNPHSPDDG